MGAFAHPLVFLSHAHPNRVEAARLEATLRSNGSGTFLDQHEISGGDRLPDRLMEGVERCTHVLVLWSAAAARSPWVRQELDYAQNERKRIIPYLLDDTPLPEDLNDRVFITREDERRGSSGLLTAVFGRSFEPTRRDQIFPGFWAMRMGVFGLAEAVMRFELRRNGQLVGECRFTDDGLLGPIIRLFAGMGIPVTGSWSYDAGSSTLTLQTHASAMGYSQDDTVEFYVTDSDGTVLKGRDPIGRQYELCRID